MVYLVGMIGFILGFALGQVVLMHLLRSRTNTEILTDKSIRLKYGLISWGITFLCCYLSIRAYQFFVLGG